MMTTKFARNVGLALIICALVLMQGDQAKAQGRDSDNWGNVTRVGIGGSVGMIGMGAAVCGIMNLGCPVGIALGGAVLGGIGGTLALMPPPQPPALGTPGSMPDFNNPCGWSCNPALLPDAPSYGNGSLSSGGTYQVGTGWLSDYYVMQQGAQKRVTVGSVAKAIVSHVNWRDSAANVALEGFSSIRQRQPRAITAGVGGLPRFGPLPVTVKPVQTIQMNQMVQVNQTRTFRARGRD